MACRITEVIRRLMRPITKVESESGMARVNTIYGLINELESKSPRILSLDLRAATTDEQIAEERLDFANDDSEIAFVARSAENLKISENALRKMMIDLLSEKNFYGQLCEFAVYDWLARHNADFSPQVYQPASEVLNKNGTELDGFFETRELYFDIKGFGFESYVRDKFKKKLASMANMPFVTIDGPRDNSVKDIENSFRKMKAAATELQTDGIARLPELGWTIRKPAPGISWEEGTYDPYGTAKENWYYPFKTARQFHRNNAFVLIFAFSPRLNGLVSLNNGGSTDIVLRSIARRAFLQTRGDTTLVSTFDAGADPAITLDDASQLLSGILFLNFSSDEAWMFLNPRAKHPLRRHSVPELFDFMLPPELDIDDFEQDNY